MSKNTGLWPSSAGGPPVTHGWTVAQIIGYSKSFGGSQVTGEIWCGLEIYQPSGTSFRHGEKDADFGDDLDFANDG